MLDRRRGPHFQHTKTAEDDWVILHPDETFGGWPESKIAPWPQTQQVTPCITLSTLAHIAYDRLHELFCAAFVPVLHMHAHRWGLQMLRE